MFGKCASDALTFPVVLGRPGIIEATCGSTGQPIRVELRPVEEAFAVDRAVVTQAGWAAGDATA